MSNHLHLVISTPSAVLVDAADVVSLRAEDKSGCFGVLPRHADFLTVLTPSVVRWRDARQTACFCALSGGVFRFYAGDQVRIACRQGLVGTALDGLIDAVAEMNAAHRDADRRARVEQTQLHARAIRQLMRRLGEDARGGSSGFGEGMGP